VITPGQLIDKAWGATNRASGMLGRMVIKRKLSTNDLTLVLAELDDAARLIRKTLNGDKL